MRLLLITAAAAALSLTATTSAWVVVESSGDDPGWYEVVNDGLIRTTAPDTMVNCAVERAMTGDRLVSPDATKDEALEVCEFDQTLEAWFTETEPFTARRERARRLTREQLDAEGRELRIVQVHSQESPTLVFVEREESEEPVSREFVEKLARQLTRAGVAVR